MIMSDGAVSLTQAQAGSGSLTMSSISASGAIQFLRHWNRKRQYSGDWRSDNEAAA